VSGRIWSSAIVSGLILVSGCAAYRPHPIDPPRFENQYRTRSLSDAGLASFVQKQSGSVWPPAALDPPALTLVALYYSPDLDLARARLAAADAAVITARARINPSISLEGGYNKTPESAATYSFIPSFTIETARKRGYRTLQAQKLAEAACIELSEAGWLVRSRVRAALMNFHFAQQRLESLRAESAVRAEVAAMFEKRVAVGESGMPELDAVRADYTATNIAIRAAESDVSQAQVALATAIGLPASSLEGVPIQTAGLDHPPAADDLPLQRVQRAGLLHRADVRRTLSEYAAADALLRLQLARQYPDIPLSPGYSLQEGFASYTLGTVIGSLPVFHRNQGPIAEAEAQRQQVEARFVALQAQAIGQMETAQRQYRAALAELAEAEGGFVKVQQEREAAARAALERGEGDRLAVAGARLLTIAAQRSRLHALFRAQAALGALEDSVQQPLEAGLAFPEPAGASACRERKP
jgi:cobalt-zinc-cadmium efflux system outer membrane protein